MLKPPLEGKISFETANVIIDWLADYSSKKEDCTDEYLLVPLFRVRQALEMYKDGTIQEFPNFEGKDEQGTEES